MKIDTPVLKPLLYALLGAGCAIGLILLREKWDKKPVLFSQALCFLKEAGKDTPIAQFDNIPFSKENLPKDLYTSYLQIETEYFKRLTDIGRQMALRMDAMTSEKGRRPEDAPSLEEVLKKKVTEKEALDFYTSNPKAFAGAPFEKVKDLIRDMLQNREDRFIINSKIQAMEKENRFHILAQAPCGAKTQIPYSNTLPGRGNTTAKMNLLVTFNFECSQCRATAKELSQFSDQNLNQLRLWFMPVPGNESSRNFQFAKLFQCAFVNSPASITSFYEKMFDLPYARSEQSEGQNELLELATKAGLARTKADQCLSDPEIAKALRDYSEFAKNHQIDGQIPRYFLNERGMAPDLGIDLVKTLKTVLSERERLKDIL